MPTPWRQRGSATAELAVVLPALVLVTVLGVWALTAAALHVRCLDAARLGARGLARGEQPARVLAVAARAAPRNASVRTLDLGDGLVAVDVRTRVGLPGAWSGGPAVTVGGRAVAQAETGDPP